MNSKYFACDDEPVDRLVVSYDKGSNEECVVVTIEMVSCTEPAIYLTTDKALALRDYLTSLNLHQGNKL
jgi:hypothetical protein